MLQIIFSKPMFGVWTDPKRGGARLSACSYKGFDLAWNPLRLAVEDYGDGNRG